MTITFSDTLPVHTSLDPVLISGEISVDYPGNQYLVLHKGNNLTGLYEIKYQTQCSPFKKALVVENILAVGHQEHFYMFDLNTHQNILILKLNGYFGHLYHDRALFYVADANGLNCIEKNGKIRWANPDLAIDGVIVNEFTESEILGSGEFDPPGGWVDFRLDKTTGNKIK